LISPPSPQSIARVLLSANVHEQYIQAKSMPHEIDYINEHVKDVTKETYGFLIFQEQIALLAHKLGKNLTLDEGNMLRKVLTKKGTGKAARVKNQLKKKFINGCVEKGIRQREAEDMWERFEYFSGLWFQQVARYLLLGNLVPVRVAMELLPGRVDGFVLGQGTREAQGKSN
jgi:hypothetical protein